MLPHSSVSFYVNQSLECCFLRVIHSLWLLHCFHFLLLHKFLSFKGRSLMKTWHLELVLQSHLFNVYYLVVDLCVNFHLLQRILWWGLSESLIYKYSNMSFVVITLLCSFRIRIAICFLVDLYSYRFYFFSSVKYRFYIIECALILKKTDLFYQNFATFGPKYCCNIFDYTV